MKVFFGFVCFVCFTERILTDIVRQRRYERQYHKVYLDDREVIMSNDKGDREQGK